MGIPVIPTAMPSIRLFSREVRQSLGDSRTGSAPIALNISETIPEDDGPVKSVAALPEERDGEDAFMAMFGADDSEESNVGDLANVVEDAELSALLQDAKSLAMVLKGEGDSHA